MDKAGRTEGHIKITMPDGEEVVWTSVETTALETYDGPYNITENGTLETSDKKLTSNIVVDVPVGSNTLKTLLDATKTCYELFRNYTGNDIADLISYDDTGEVTNMNQMFYQCPNITSIPLLNTSKVTNMRAMFEYCDHLISVPLLNTSEVTNMNSIFHQCIELISVPLFNTSNVTNMGYMFNSCYALTSVPLFDTSNVEYMHYMFYDCSHLTSIPALDVSKVTKFSGIFDGCTALTEIKMTGMKATFDISASTQFSETALVDILNNLADMTGHSAPNLIMGRTNLDKLTQAEKNIALNKNWTLS